MSTALTLAKIAALACLCAVLLTLDRAAQRVESALVTALAQYAALPAQLDAHAARAATLVDLRSKEVIRTADRRVAEVTRVTERAVHVADGRLASLQASANSQIGNAVQRLDARAQEATGAIVELRGDVSLTLAETRALEASTRRAVELLTPQALGLVAASKVTAGEFAQAARRVDAALPAALLTWQEIGANSARTTAATAGAMRNLEAATKPLPKWLRYPLAITGAVAPTAAGAVSAAAATGAFR